MSQLWELVWGRSQVDPVALATAIETELNDSEPDFRTRVLIRDGTEALARHWGSERLGQWLRLSPARLKIEAIRQEDLGKTGFPLLKEQLMDKTDPETVRQFLRDLGTRVEQPTRLNLGGAIALILGGFIARATSDIDIVDEVPESIRKERELLDSIQQRYGLLLTHFQSHYLPQGWEQRIHFLDSFGRLDVYTVDVYDLFIGKLFSKRAKDLDDLRMILPKLDKDQLPQRVKETAGVFLRDEALRETASRNWYVLFGSQLPE